MQHQHTPPIILESRMLDFKRRRFDFTSKFKFEKKKTELPIGIERLSINASLTTQAL